MMKRKQLSLIVLTTIGLISCDPYGGYEYWIQNQSISTIYVFYKVFDNDTVKCQKLTSDQEFQLVQFDTHNGLDDDGLDNLFSFCDSLAVYSDTINKILISMDITLRENWTYEQVVTSSLMNAGHNIYKLTVEDEDIK